LSELVNVFHFTITQFLFGAFVVFPVLMWLRHWGVGPVRYSLLVLGISVVILAVLAVAEAELLGYVNGWKTIPLNFIFGCAALSVGNIFAAIVIMLLTDPADSDDIGSGETNSTS